MTRYRITVLGSSSGMPSPSRFCSSIFVQTKNFNFLLDCGEGTSFSLLGNKIDPQLIDAVFISHTHIDHMGGLLLLIQMLHLLRRRSPLSLYIPEEAVVGLKDFLNTCYLSSPVLSFEIRAYPVTEKFMFEYNGVIIKTQPNRHLRSNQAAVDALKLPQKMQSFCYLVESEGKKIVYSGDIESARDLSGIADDADLLITECTHPQPEELISLIAQKGVKAAVLTHIPPEFETDQDKLLNRAAKMGLENVRIAYDGLAFEI